MRLSLAASGSCIFLLLLLCPSILHMLFVLIVEKGISVTSSVHHIYIGSCAIKGYMEQEAGQGVWTLKVRIVCTY